jgi:hypothetical protein
MSLVVTFFNMIFLYRSPIPVGLGEIGGYSYNLHAVHTELANRKKATFLSQKNPFVLFSFIPHLHAVKNVIKGQTIYRYKEILKKDYDTEKAS